jgi:hypothetical protein
VIGVQGRYVSSGDLGGPLAAAVAGERRVGLQVMACHLPVVRRLADATAAEEGAQGAAGVARQW